MVYGWGRWTSARHNLEETFDIMPHIYNINDLENGIIKEVLNKGDIKNAGEIVYRTI